MDSNPLSILSGKYNPDREIFDTLNTSMNELSGLASVYKGIITGIDGGSTKFRETYISDIFNGRDTYIIDSQVTDGSKREPIVVFFDGKIGEDGRRADIESIHTLSTLKDVINAGYYDFTFEDFANNVYQRRHGKSGNPVEVSDITSGVYEDITKMMLTPLAGITYSLDQFAISDDQKEEMFNQMIASLENGYEVDAGKTGILSRLIDSKKMYALKSQSAQGNTKRIYDTILTAEKIHNLDNGNTMHANSLYDIAKQMELELKESQGINEHPTLINRILNSPYGKFAVTGLILSLAALSSGCTEEDNDDGDIVDDVAAPMDKVIGYVGTEGFGIHNVEEELYEKGLFVMVEDEQSGNPAMNPVAAVATSTYFDENGDEITILKVGHHEIDEQSLPDGWEKYLIPESEIIDINMDLVDKLEHDGHKYYIENFEPAKDSKMSVKFIPHPIIDGEIYAVLIVDKEVFDYYRSVAVHDIPHGSNSFELLPDGRYGRLVKVDEVTSVVCPYNVDDYIDAKQRGYREGYGIYKVDSETGKWA